MRDAEFERKLEQMSDATARGFEEFVRSHMPDCLYRDFCLWGVSRQNPYRPAFLQIIGATQMSKLSVRLLAGLAKGEKNWQTLLRAWMTIHSWQILENISDNMAMGLARYETSDSGSDAIRRALLRDFNTLTAKRLKGAISAASARDALSGFCSGEVSLFRQHLAPLKFRSLAEAFIKKRRGERGGALSELEHSVGPHLVANIEACVAVADAIEIEQLHSLSLSALIARYESVNRLLESDELALEERLDAGAYTILVIPTLGYFISALVRVTGTDARLERMVDEGTLDGALYDAALLVRLQNDIGMGLLTFDDSARLSFLHKVEERGREREGESFSGLITRIGREYPALNRIWKDASLGEFNVCLSGIGRASFSSEILSEFGLRLALFAEIYSAHKAKLASKLREMQRIKDGLKKDRISQIILRFVRFHEQLYDGHYHDTVDGDYAI
jgi:hypothetical protein